MNGLTHAIAAENSPVAVYELPSSGNALPFCMRVGLFIRGLACGCLFFYHFTHCSASAAFRECGKKQVNNTCLRSARRDALILKCYFMRLLRVGLDSEQNEWRNNRKQHFETIACLWSSGSVNGGSEDWGSTLISYIRLALKFAGRIKPQNCSIPT